MEIIKQIKSLKQLIAENEIKKSALKKVIISLEVKQKSKTN